MSYSCEDCTYFLPTLDSSFGRCRRFPPILSVPAYKAGSAVWPIVAEYDWCGELKEKDRE